MSDQKSYVCICGKVFDNPQKFNGHKSNCKVHLLNKYGNLDAYREKHKRTADKISASMIQYRANQKNAKLNQWISEQHKCEHCGKIMTEYYASGRFCCTQCAKAFSTASKREEINNKLRLQNNLEHRYRVARCSVCNADVHVGVTANINDYICKRCRKLLSDSNREARLLSRYKLGQEYHLSESPYSEFDTLYLNYDFRNDPYVYLVKHDNAGKDIKRCKVYLYRYNIELELHRRLNSNEVIHHIDGNHFNNDRSNLIVLTNSIHTRLHGGSLTLEEILANHLYIYK